MPARSHERPPSPRLGRPADLQRGRQPRADSSPRCATVAAGATADPRRRRRLARRHRRDRRPPRRRRTHGVDVLHRAVKEGLGPAYVAGFRRALDGGADLIVQMDADFSHDPADVPRLIAAAKDADLVLGSRYVEGGGVGEWGRRAPRDLPRRQPYARLLARARRPRPDRRLQVLPARGARGDPAGDDRRARLRLPGRDDLPGACAPASASSRCRSIFNDRRVGESKMSRAIVAEAVWRVPVMRLAAGAWRRCSLDLQYFILCSNGSRGTLDRPVRADRYTD